MDAFSTAGISLDVLLLIDGLHAMSGGGVRGRGRGGRRLSRVQTAQVRGTRRQSEGRRRQPARERERNESRVSGVFSLVLANCPWAE